MQFKPGNILNEYQKDDREGFKDNWLSSYIIVTNDETEDCQVKATLSPLVYLTLPAMTTISQVWRCISRRTFIVTLETTIPTTRLNTSTGERSKLQVKPGDIVKACYGDTRFICVRVGRSPCIVKQPIMALYCIQSNHEYKVGSTYIFDSDSSWIQIEESLVTT